ncbi:MAG: sugar-binding protein [Planctomycetota bacterium]
MKRSNANKYIVSILILFMFVSAKANWPLPKKKVIEYGHGSPDENTLAKNIREMEKRPFDGIIFRLNGYLKAFDHENRWDANDIARRCQTLKSIKWEKFTDNFMVLRVASEMDWYNDKHWDNITHNITLFTKAVVAGRCKGICLDPEPYGHSPWAYDAENHIATHRNSKTYQEYCKQVRKRGFEYMQAIQLVKPDICILTFFQLSEYYKTLSDSAHTAATTDNDLEKHYYAMMYAFLNGMLDAAGPGVTFIDGNENAYYYTKSSEFDRIYVNIKQRYRYLIAPENRDKYNAQMQVGSGLFTDLYFSTYRWPADAIGSFLTPQQQLKFFEQLLYYALDTADEYVWVYSEEIDWWTNKNVPAGAYDVISSVKDKIANLQKLGFNMDKVIADAKERQQEVLFGDVAPRNTQIHKVSDVVPLIDGNIIDDVFWQQIQPLEPFVPINRMMKEKTTYQTEAKLAWDDNFLYVAMKCIEPNIKRIGIVGNGHDGGIWGGDVVEFYICPGLADKPIYHFALNPANVQWDAITEKDEEVLSWNADWQSGVKINLDNWTVEMAIPWNAIGGIPKHGEHRKGNLTRQRDPRPKELSSWTPLQRYFNESQNYGKWLFCK